MYTSQGQLLRKAHIRVRQGSISTPSLSRSDAG